MRRPVSLAFLALNWAVTTLFLAAPFSIAPGTARNLDGLANVRDHDWTAFPLTARIAYGMGDLICHQMEARSFIGNQNEFPVDARLLPMFLFGNVGLLAIRTLPDLPRVDRVLSHVGPTWTIGRRRAFTPLLMLAALLPTAIDGTLQLATPYESTNLLRALTGAWMGLAGATGLGLWFDALAAPALTTSSRDGDAKAQRH